MNLRDALIDIALSPYERNRSVANMERHRTAPPPDRPEADEPEPVDVMKWLAAQPLRRRCALIHDAMAEAHSLEDGRVLEEFQQIAGSAWGQRALKWLQDLADSEAQR